MRGKKAYNLNKGTHMKSLKAVIEQARKVKDEAALLAEMVEHLPSAINVDPEAATRGGDKKDPPPGPPPSQP